MGFFPYLLRKRGGLSHAEETGEQRFTTQGLAEIRESAVDIVGYLGHAPLVRPLRYPETSVIGVALKQHGQSASEWLSVVQVGRHQLDDACG
jgi:hypothetical protein